MSCPINLIIIIGIITVLIAIICRRTTGQSPCRPALPSSSGTTGQQEIQFTQRRKSTRNPWTIFSIPVGYYQLHATSSESELKDIFQLDNNQLGFCENNTILAIFNNINQTKNKRRQKRADSDCPSPQVRPPLRHGQRHLHPPAEGRAEEWRGKIRVPDHCGHQQQGPNTSKIYSRLEEVRWRSATWWSLRPDFKISSVAFSSTNFITTLQLQRKTAS